MAKKKNEIKKRGNSKKQTEELKKVDDNIIDSFISDAKSTVITEEETKRPVYDKSKKIKEDTEHIISEEPKEVTNDDSFENAPIEEEVNTEVLQTTIDEEPINDYTVTEEKDNSETSGENIPVNTETDKSEDVKKQEPTKQEPTKKKRSTTKEVYGFHWMGQIFD